jgi:hypothetical protein
MSRWGKRWLAWVLLFAGSFAVLEGIALADPARGDTLSEQVWGLLQYPAFSVPFFIVWCGGAVWLTLHWFRRYRP